MTEWALLKDGEIIGVVTTARFKQYIQECFPDYDIHLLYNLPTEVRQRYRYWGERP